MAPAVIIPWRDEGDGGASLRYALRSVDAHLPHSEVLVAGDELAWTAGVVNLVTERDGSRLVDSRQSMLAAARTTGAEWAYLMDDDVYIMRPVDYIAPAHRGPLEASPHRGYYYAAGYRTKAYLARHGVDSPKNYSTHMPLLVNVARFLEIIEAAAADIGDGFWVRATYANMAGLVGRQIIDPKKAGVGIPNLGFPVWSGTDRSFTHGALGKEVRARFPHPGRYEQVGLAA